jgi:hypothetical protein
MMRKMRQSHVEGESKTPAPVLRDLKENPEKTDRMQIRYQIGRACRQSSSKLQRTTDIGRLPNSLVRSNRGRLTHENAAVDR